MSIRPDANEAIEASAERVVVPMTCASEGAVDVYVEPIVRPRAIVVDGMEQGDVAPDAAAMGARVATLEQLGAVLHETVAQAGECAAVVASQGHYDEPALETIVKSDAPYVGLVASPKRGAAILAWLTGNHVPNVERLRSPAGLALGGRSPEEVALSILGEIVQLGSRAQSAEHGGTTSTGRDPRTSIGIDPVCHMEVEIAGAAHVAELDGVSHYFCCPGCRARFVKDPQRYLSPAS